MFTLTLTPSAGQSGVDWRPRFMQAFFRLFTQDLFNLDFLRIALSLSTSWKSGNRISRNFDGVSLDTEYVSQLST